MNTNVINKNLVNRTKNMSNENIQNTSKNIDWNGTIWTDRNFSHPERTITVGTSCSGIGAIEHSLQQLGLKSKIMFAGDIDKHVKKSYFANYPISEEQWHNDMFEFDASPYKGKISIFMAGICCQTFSRAGGLAGIDDSLRGQLFRAFKRIVAECEPEVWILENVDNMLTCHNGRDWKVIKSELETLGYDIHFQVLNACDYGVPQSRKRLFVIGFKNKTDFLFPAPIELKQSIYDVLEDKTSCQRRLTPREALRLQGFSDDFKIVVPRIEAYHQAGNSIAVPVLNAIFKQMDITKYGF